MAKITRNRYEMALDYSRVLNRKIDSVKAYIVINRNKKISATTKKAREHYLKRQKAYENRLVKLNVKKKQLDTFLLHYAGYFK